jgi:hypothetical protein
VGEKQACKFIQLVPSSVCFNMAFDFLPGVTFVYGFLVDFRTKYSKVYHLQG